MLSLKNFYHIKMPSWITTNFNPMYRTYIPEQLLIHDSTFNPVDINLDSSLPYSMYRKFKRAHQEFTNNFINNSFGHPCSVCDRLWFQNDPKSSSPEHKEILSTIMPNIPENA
jgi:hypothetical protein